MSQKEFDHYALGFAVHLAYLLDGLSDAEAEPIIDAARTLLRQLRVRRQADPT